MYFTIFLASVKAQIIYFAERLENDGNGDSQGCLFLPPGFLQTSAGGRGWRRT